MNESINHPSAELPEEPEVVLPQPLDSVEQISDSVQPDVITESDQKGWFKSSVHSAKRVVQSAALTVEMLPITNEGARYGALAATEVITRNPLIGAAVLGGTTLAIEGASALAASEFITGKTGNHVFEWLNKKVDKFIPEDAKMSRVVESGVAMTLGTPVLMAIQQKQNPNRTNAEARKQGLLTAAWMAGVFAVEGALISKGIGDSGVPAKIGAAAIVAGSAVALPKWVKNVLKEKKSEKSILGNFGEVQEIIAGGTILPEQVDKSADLYESFRNSEDEAVKIGLYGEDLKAAYNNPKSLIVEYKNSKNEYSHAPVLVPLEDLVWYNMDLLKKTYGHTQEFYYYAHPPIPESEESRASISKLIKDKVDEGIVIFTDEYTSKNDGILSQISEDESEKYSLENVGGGDRIRNASVYDAPVTFNGVTEIKEAASLHEAYRSLVESGEIVENTENGVSLLESVTGEDAEKIWQIYRGPFDKLTQDHPMYAGYEKDVLLEILADTEVAKMVNRIDGKITTLCFFVQDFDSCPWFNKQYYEEKYPEYYKTGNIAMFPGIVTDESAGGNGYSLPVISLAAKLFAKRGSNILVTFECTETSADYIPTIVNLAINRSGSGSVDNITDPISVMEYKALRLSA